MKFIGIIPARYQSTRFPGKPLAKIHGKPMIQWVYENALKALDQVCVATDDERIFEAVKAFGGEVVFTLNTHQSGTDRCAEAAKLLEEKFAFDVVVNIQGDEPFLQAEQLEKLKLCFKDTQVQIATLVKKIESSDDVFNPNRPKVVFNKNWDALYFSRSPVPFIRGKEKDAWFGNNTFWGHIGLYAFKAEVLQHLSRLEQGRLELAESLEQLRWLENGYIIRVAETKVQTIGIDTPEDLAEALKHF